MIPAFRVPSVAAGTSCVLGQAFAQRASSFNFATRVAVHCLSRPWPHLVPGHLFLTPLPLPPSLSLVSCRISRLQHPDGQVSVLATCISNNLRRSKPPMQGCGGGGARGGYQAYTQLDNPAHDPAECFFPQIDALGGYGPEPGLVGLCRACLAVYGSEAEGSMLH